MSFVDTPDSIMQIVYPLQTDSALELVVDLLHLLVPLLLIALELWIVPFEDSVSHVLVELSEDEEVNHHRDEQLDDAEVASHVGKEVTY